MIREGRARLPVDLLRRAEDRVLPRPARQPPAARRARPAVPRCSTCSPTRAASRSPRLLGGARRAVNVDASRDALGARPPGVPPERPRGAATTTSSPATPSPSPASWSSPASGFDVVVVDPPAFVAPAGRARGRPARLQGHQPAGAPAGRAGRPAAHLLVLGAGRRGGVRRGAARRRRRRRPDGARPRASVRRAGPPARPGLSREPAPPGLAVRGAGEKIGDSGAGRMNRRDPSLRSG